ncbi:MAG: SDR family NAD(P)-dependent oxidoreductase, partial [Acetobacteraceae bacterium]|nr:SDR family NAD(P)-dependent oxidoreductase [Acetobacteraceae bacterium]
MFDASNASDRAAYMSWVRAFFLSGRLRRISSTPTAHVMTIFSVMGASRCLDLSWHCAGGRRKAGYGWGHPKKERIMSRLDGKVALLSGAARGIGGETARLMAQAGAKLVIGDVLDEVGRQTVAAINADGGQAEYVHLDVTKEDDWIAAVNTVTAKFGKLDILVNNAGVFIGKGIEEISLAEWDKLVAVNMTGVFLGTKLCAPALREAAKNSEHGSAIVNLASIAGIVGSQLDPLYSMTKGGVTLFTKSTALEFGRKGYRIRCNSIHPGVIQTDMG